MWNSREFWLVLFAVMEIALCVGVTIHAVQWKRDSRAVIDWVGFTWFAPIVGAVAQVCLGIN